MKFTELNLNEKLLKGIEGAGFTALMPVQEATLKHSLTGRDVSVQSQTGTGKTAAFLITIFQHFLNESNNKNKKALILAPTRELAIQIEMEAKLLGRFLPFSIGSFYGGVGYHLQERLLAKDVDIMVGTPGRLLDFNNKGKLDFKKIGYLVIDEADRMFDMGFLPDIRRILRKTENSENRQTMLFSATLDENSRSIGREFMNQSINIEISPEKVTVDKITQLLYHVSQKEKLNLLLGILRNENPQNALIFTNMKHVAEQVAKHLEYNGYTCLHISGDLPQAKRIQVLDNFKSGKLPVLVATDVAARGLHIDDLQLIINYDLPSDCENYVHRIGRTARAGKSGKAISLACEDYIYNLDAIQSYIGMKIPVAFADDSLYLNNKSEGMIFNSSKRSGDTTRKTRKSTILSSAASRSRKTYTKSAAIARDNSKNNMNKKMEPTKKTTPHLKNADPEKPQTDNIKKNPKEKKPTSTHKKKSTPTTSTSTSTTTTTTASASTPSTPSTSTSSKKTLPQDSKKNKPYSKKTTDTNSFKNKEKTKDSSETTPKPKTSTKPKPTSPRSRHITEEQRLEYYKKKYGDNFNIKKEKPEPSPTSHKSQTPPITQTNPNTETKPKSFLQKIASFFKSKKNTE